jgi:molybdopterin converting factor subunit 1
MRVNVLYFAQTATAAGLQREQLELPAGATLAALQQRLVERHPQLGPLLPALLWAVDEQVAGCEHPLAPGQTVAVMPPFSGG